MRRIGEPLLDPERLGDEWVGRDRLDPIVGLQEWCVVLPLQQGEDGIDLQVVLHDLPPEGERQVSLVHGDRDVVGHPDPLDLHDFRANRQPELPGDLLGGRYRPRPQQSRRRLQADRHHVLDEPGQGGQLLGELGLPDERPLASPDLDQFEALELLNGLPHRGPTDAVFPDQLLLRGELTAGSKCPVGDRRRQVLLDLKVERNGTLGFAFIRSS